MLTTVIERVLVLDIPVIHNKLLRSAQALCLGRVAVG